MASPPQSHRPLSFIDASGVHALLDAAAHPRCTGGRLTFVHCPASLPRLLGLLGLERALEIEAPAPLARPASRAPRAGAVGLEPERAAL